MKVKFRLQFAFKIDQDLMIKKVVYLNNIKKRRDLSIHQLKHVHHGFGEPIEYLKK